MFYEYRGTLYNLLRASKIYLEEANKSTDPTIVIEIDGYRNYLRYEDEVTRMDAWSMIIECLQGGDENYDFAHNYN